MIRVDTIWLEYKSEKLKKENQSSLCPIVCVITAIISFSISFYFLSKRIKEKKKKKNIYWNIFLPFDFNLIYKSRFIKSVVEIINNNFN